jgi:tetratricopeptide (TPR) repeat protein
MEIIYKELLEAMDKGCLVVFCGSGTSSSLGLPTWKGLVMEVIDQIGADKPEFLPLKDLLTSDILSPLLILDLLEDEYRPLITEVLSEKIDQLDKYLPYTLQKKLFKISEKIITTNYDKAFENAVDIPNVILNDGRFKLAKIADHKRFLFKLHGDIDNPEDCILFSSQFKSLYSTEAFLLGLKILFIQKTILFVGFSLDDPYVAEIINNITESFNAFNRKHYIVTTDVRFNSERFRKKVKPHIIKDYTELDVFLDNLINFNVARNRQIAVHNIKFEQGVVQLWNNGELEAVSRCVQARRNVTAIWGDPGSGKSSLAREFALLCLENSRSRINLATGFAFAVWFTIEDTVEQANHFNDLLDEIGRITGFLKVTYLSSEDLERKVQQVNEILRTHAVLIIIDNYHLSNDLKLEEWIQQINPPSEVILTSVRQLAFSHNPYRVPGLTKESIRQFVIQETETRGIDSKKFSGPETINQLYEITSGNPQAMLLAIGIIANLANVPELVFKSEAPITQRFEILYSFSWNKLSETSKNLLAYFPLLADKSSIEADALKHISNLNYDVFNGSILEMIKWNLITADNEGRSFRIHITLMDFLKDKAVRQDDQVAIRIRYISYYLRFVKDSIERDYPNEEYWNSLVSAKMDVLDAQIEPIFIAIKWSSEIPGQEDNFLSFVKVILHYLDSRLYNQRRIDLVQKAIGLCEKNEEKYLEAILKIDALGWTFVEEDDLTNADLIISSGRDIAEKHLLEDERRDDLLALSSAWLARVRSEQSKNEEAKEHIRQALNYNGKPWIQYRIHMAAGDVYYKTNDLSESLRNYQLAKTKINEYRGEGANYQISPRLALAYLRIGSDVYLSEAERIFTSLKQNTRIKIGELYGEFGLAMIAYERGFKDGVKEKVLRLEGELTRRSPKNLLLKLVTQYKKEKFPD